MDTPLGARLSRPDFSVAGNGGRRPLSRAETRVDVALHAIGIAAALAGAVALLLLAAPLGAKAAAAASVYAGALLTMLGCSAAYNLGRQSRFRNALCGLDQSAIFLMIAGTYTPVAMLGLGGAAGQAMTMAVWGAAATCILLRLCWPRAFHRLSVLLYLGLGWMGVALVGPLLHAVGTTVVVLLGAGGALYSFGVIFHLWERLPFQNVIWHAFVLAAAGVHFAAVIGSLLAA
jgi:hemolysin III